LQRTIDQPPLALAADPRRTSMSRLPMIGVSRLLKSCATPAGELAHRLHLLALAQCLLGFPEPLLLAQPLGHVRHELVGAECFPIRAAQHAEPHLVITPVEGRIAELVDLDELFPADRPGPHGLHRGLITGAVLEHLQHVVAHSRLRPTEDTCKLRGGCGIDREPIIVAVEDLDEDVRTVDHVREQSAFGQRFRDAKFQRCVEVAQLSLGNFAVVNVDGRTEPAHDLARGEVAMRFAAHQEPPILTTPGANPVLDEVGGACAPRLVEGRHRRTRVLRMDVSVAHFVCRGGSTGAPV
jgi:hypothetical protein